MSTRGDVLAPWGTRPRVTLILGNLVALASMAGAWWAVSGSRSASDQHSLLTVGLAGVLMAGAANGIWLGAGRKAIRSARSAILPTLPEGALSASSGVTEIRSEALFSGNGMSWFHQSGCLLSVGKSVAPATRREHELAGRSPCEVCRP
jgi:hypothetical protein